MMPLAGGAARAAPVEAVAALRAARAAAAGDTDTSRLAAFGLQRLDGGRNNAVFSWAPALDGLDGLAGLDDWAGTHAGDLGGIQSVSGPGRPVCVKVYRRADRQRVVREWHGLGHAARHGRASAPAPAPLWFDQHPDAPALGMTLLAGAPILDVLDPAQALAEVATVTAALQTTPLGEPLSSLERVDAIGHYITRLTDVWPAQLANTDAADSDAADSDALTPVMRGLLQRWQDGGDAALLRTAAATPVFSRGDANLQNWLHDHHAGRTVVVDFEYSGYSDVAVDAADHVEHISARAIPDPVWEAALPAFGVSARNRARFEAARRTTALRWLAVLWRQRHQRAAEFATQYQRVATLLS